MKHLLQPWFADAILEVFEEAQDEGIRIRITSTYRSSADQFRLRRAFIRRGKKGLPAAPPGQSFHEVGLAVDYVTSGRTPEERSDNMAEVGAIAEEIGLRWGGPFGDPVHIDAARQISLRQARRNFDVRSLVRIA